MRARVLQLTIPGGAACVASTDWEVSISAVLSRIQGWVMSPADWGQCEAFAAMGTTGAPQDPGALLPQRTVSSFPEHGAWHDPNLSGRSWGFGCGWL